MRHQKQKNPSFGRNRGPRKALIRGLVNNLVENERIKTTLTKAKYVRPLVEKAITMGKAGSVHSRRLLLSRYPNKNTVDKIMTNLSPRFKDRQGGYTRIIKLGYRAGDQAPLAYIEFVDYNTQQQAKLKKEPAKTKKAVKAEAKEEKTEKAVKAAKTEKTTKPEKTTKAEKAETKTEKTSKKTSAKKSSTQVSQTTDKKQKKQLLAKIDKKRKKFRRKQKKSRRINR